MITPRFKLAQDATTVTITIRAPYGSLRDLEVSAEDEVFVFHSKPYYLRLNLPGSIRESDSTRSSFDADSGVFTFQFEKTTANQHFPDLDLITTLLCPKVEVLDPENSERKITILSHETEDRTRSADELDEEFGFALAGKRNFNSVSSEFGEVFEIDPREVPLGERRRRRLQFEQGKFNIDHYLCDYIENDEIAELIKLQSPNQNLEFSDEDLDFLKDLPNKDYRLSDLQVGYCHCGLLDILYAYCYDRRTTCFDRSSESGWTIVKLAASLSWLDAFKEPRETLVSGFRRSVIYPLYRNFELSQKILDDLKQLLKLGEKCIVKCLIEIHSIFLHGDCCRYILNNLFIRDYVVYVMKWDKKKWRDVVAKVDEITIHKQDLGLNLTEIEDNVSSRLGGLSNLKIEEGDSDDDSSSESDSSDENDSATTSDSD